MSCTSASINRKRLAVTDKDKPSQLVKPEDFLAVRIVELEAKPVKGDFDLNHLREIHRRIFQDMPKLGITDITPGALRDQVPEGREWIKVRGLESTKHSYVVAYSRMDELARARLDKALAAATPDKLARLEKKEFTKKMAQLYAQLDYAHPFQDGNSRTLRTFTRQLAREAGYTLEWGKLSRTPQARDNVCIMRDHAVNKLAMTWLVDATVQRDVQTSLDMLHYGSGKLELLFDRAVSPTRALAFSRDTREVALQAHPELKDAYKALDMAAKNYNAGVATQSAEDRARFDMVKDFIQSQLDAGHFRGFSQVVSDQIAPGKKLDKER